MGNLQTKVLEYLKQQPYTWAVKVMKANQNGCPDILCCCKGVFWGIEVKKKNEKLLPRQVEQLRRIKVALGKVIVIRSMQELKKMDFEK